MGDINNFRLPAMMSIDSIESLAAELKQLSLAEKTSFTLDAAAVEAITTPGLQLVVALEKTLTGQGGTLAITGAGEGCRSAFKDAGLERLLGKSSR